MALTKIDDRGLKTPIELLNNEEITLGNSGSKLKIYHDGSNNHSYIEQASSVNVLFIEANHPRFVSRTGHEMLISANLNGAVELYYNNSKKFETTSYGGIFGNETSSSVASPVRLSLGGTHHSSAGGDPKLSVWTNGSNHMGFGVSNNQLDLILTENDYDFVVYGGSSGTTERFRVYGDNSGIQIPDSSIARFGSNSDLQLYHSGSHSYIENTTNYLFIHSNYLALRSATQEAFIDCKVNDSVDLYYDNSKKLETTSTGATVTGTLVADHPLGNRNMLLNGNMRIAQRLDGNDGGSKTLTAGNYRGVDLSVVRTSNSSNLTITHPAHGSLQELGLHNSLKVVAASANSSFVSNAYTSVVTHLEGNHIIPTCWGKSTAKTCTLSFYVRSNVTGTFSGSFGNSSNNRANAFEYTINSSDTWERKTITVTGDTTGTWNKDHNLGAKITWSLGHGSNFSTASSNVGTWAGAELMGTDSQVNFCAATNNFWEISGVQFELGSAATPIEHQPFSQTLRNCRRYYFKNKPYGENLYAVDTWNTGSGTMSQNKRGDGTNGAYDTHYWWPDGDMRTNPTITFYGSDGTVNKHRFEQVGVVNAEFVVPVDTLNSKTTGFFVRITVNSSHTSNAAFYTNSGDCFVRLSLDASSEF